MRTSQHIKLIFVGASLLGGLTACSFFGGEEQAAEVTAGEEESAAEGEEATAGAENAAAINETASTEGDALPSDTGVANTELPGDFGTSNTAMDPVATEALPSSNAAETNTVPVAMDPAATNGTAEMAPAVAPPSASAPSGSSMVYYVNTAGASLYSNPDGSGPAVGTLAKGDPVLVTVQGNWANVSNRGWIQLSALSMAPIGRDKAARSWN